MVDKSPGNRKMYVIQADFTNLHQAMIECRFPNWSASSENYFGQEQRPRFSFHQNTFLKIEVAVLDVFKDIIEHPRQNGRQPPFLVPK
jgi:hypothetical protein